jgi:hypothetical protein
VNAFNCPSRCLAMDIDLIQIFRLFRPHATLFLPNSLTVSHRSFLGFPLFRFFFLFFLCQPLPPVPLYVRSSRAATWYGLLNSLRGGWGLVLLSAIVSVLEWVDPSTRSNLGFFVAQQYTYIWQFASRFPVQWTSCRFLWLSCRLQE